MLVVISFEGNSLSTLAAGLRSRGMSHLVAVQGGDAANSVLELNPVSVVVLDVRHCHRGWLASFGQRFSDTPCVALTSDDAAATLSLLPPMTTVVAEQAGWDELADRIVEQQQRGPTSTVAAVGLEDVLNLLVMTGADAVVDVVTARDRGRIWLQHGDIVHAERGHREGLQVAYEIFDWMDPHVTTRPLRGRTLERTSMRVPATLLLHDAAVRNDELGRLADLPQSQRILSRLSTWAGVLAVAIIHVDREEIVVSEGSDARILVKSMAKVAAAAMRSWAGIIRGEDSAALRGCAQWDEQQIHVIAPMDSQLVLSVVARDGIDLNRLRESVTDAAFSLTPLISRTACPAELAQAVAW